MEADNNEQVLQQDAAIDEKQTVSTESSADAIPQSATPVSTAVAEPQTGQSTSGLAIAGLVLGIIAILGAFIPLLNIFTAPFAIIGLILAIIGFMGVKNGKHTGRGIAIAGIVLGAVALVVTIGMYGCAGAIAGSSSSSSTTSSEPESTSSSVAENADVSATDVLGLWHMVSGEVGGETFGPDEIARLEAGGEQYYVKFVSDGQFAVVFGNKDRAFKGKWKDEGAGTIALSTQDASGTMEVDGDSAALSLEIEDGSRIILNLEKSSSDESGTTASSASDVDSGSSAAAEEESSSESTEVSPDLKEALDSYEAFMDEYVAFMQKYKESGNATSMLADYTTFLQKYTDFAQKIDSMDTSNMSAADYAYYVEVTSRVSQKLLAVL